MAESKRDRSIGLSWLAYYALQGDEDIAFLREYLWGEAAENGVSSVVLLGLAEALDPNGKSEWQLKLCKRGKGRPSDRTTRANKGRRAADLVQALVDSGVKQEAAIEEVSTREGLGRAELFQWLKSNRAAETLVDRVAAGEEVILDPEMNAKIMRLIQLARKKMGH